jgi:hypothetical protein
MWCGGSCVGDLARSRERLVGRPALRQAHPAQAEQAFPLAASMSAGGGGVSRLSEGLVSLCAPALQQVHLPDPAASAIIAS